MYRADSLLNRARESDNVRPDELSPSVGISFCVITVNHVGSDIIRAVSSIQALGCTEYEVVVAGEVPSDLQVDTVLPNRRAAQTGFLGSLRNQAISAAKYETVVVLNDDVSLAPDFGTALALQTQSWDVLSGQIRNPDGTRFWDWATYGGPRGHCLLPYSQVDPYVYLQSSVYVIRRSVALKTNWETESYRGAPLDEVEYSRSLRASGFELRCCTALLAFHHDPGFTQIDDYPRPLFPRDNLELLSEGLYGRGFYQPETNGTRLLAQKSELRVSANLLNSSGVLSFLLQAHAQELYDTWPLQVVLRNGDDEIATLKFQVSGERHHVTLPIGPSSNQDLCISIEANSAISAQLSINHRDHRVFSLFIGELQFEQRDNLFSLSPLITALSADGTKEKRPRINQCTVISPHLSSLPAGQYARTLLRSLHRSGMSLELDTYLAEPQVIQELTNNQEQRRFWQQMHRNKISSGVCLAFVPLEVAPDTQLLSRLRTQHHYCKSALLLTYATRSAHLIGLPEAIQGYDEVWVPSEYQRHTLIRIGIDPDQIQVVNPGVDHERFNPETVVPLPLAVQKGFTFISDLPISRDSGWEHLLTAYYSAFSRRDEVALILRIQEHGAHAQAAVQQIRDFIHAQGNDHPSSASLFIFDAGRISEEQLPALYALADVFLLPHLNEIWNHILLRPMAMGVPIIASNSGSTAELIDDEIGDLINCSTAPNYHQDNIPSLSYGIPSVEHTITLMQHAYDARKIYQEKGTAARARILDYFKLDQYAYHLQKWVQGAVHPKRVRRKSSSADSSLGTQNLAAQISIEQFPATATDDLDSVTGYRCLKLGIDARILTDSALSHTTEATITTQLIAALDLMGDECPTEISLHLGPTDYGHALQELLLLPQVRLVTHLEGETLDPVDVWLDPDPLRLLQTTIDNLKPPESALSLGLITDILPLVRRDIYLDKWAPQQRASFIKRLGEITQSSMHFIAATNSAANIFRESTGLSSERIYQLGVASVLNPQSAPSPYSTLKISVAQRLTESGVPYFAVVGPLASHRNIPGIILALDQVKLTKNAALVLMHHLNDPMASFYRDLCSRNKIDGVHFASLTDSAQILSAAAALVCGSTHDGVLIELLDAAHLGCPIISPPSRILSELVGSGFIMTEDSSPDALARSMLSVMDRPTIVDAARARARARAVRVTWTGIAARLYSTILRQLFPDVPETQTQARAQDPAQQHPQENLFGERR